MTEALLAKNILGSFVAKITSRAQKLSYCYKIWGRSLPPPPCRRKGDLWTPTHHNQKWRRTKASSAEETCYRRTEASSLLSIHNRGDLWTPLTLCSSYKQEGGLWTPTHLNKRWRRTKASSEEETCYRRIEASSLLSLRNIGCSSF